MPTIVTNGPGSLVQRTKEAPDPELVGQWVDLADRDGHVVARARVATVEERGLVLSDLQEIPETDRFTIATSMALQAWTDEAAFGRRAIRPEQAEFRKLLLAAYDGRCAFTGCDVPAALDAAHLHSWRTGNKAHHGILARLDIHGLLDAGLITVGPDFRIRVEQEAIGHYGELDGRRISLPKRKADWPRDLSG